jgi:23S rRNA (uracil1939-C5)-methyltransferase
LTAKYILLINQKHLSFNKVSKKNKHYILESATVVDFAAEGKCIVKNEGEVIFVAGANVAPGDVVKLFVTKSKKKFSEATVLAYLELSKDRIEPFCNHFGTCGGCKWQHIPYERQLDLKQKQVFDQLSRIGKIKMPEMNMILGSEKTQYYRNKLEYSFSEDRWHTREQIDAGVEFEKNAFGFHAPGRFDKVIEIQHCFLQGSISNDIRNFLREYVNEHQFTYYNHRLHQGFMRSMMLRNSAKGFMVVIQFAEERIEEIEIIMAVLKEKFPEITSLNYIINQKKNDTFFDLDVVTFSGDNFILEQMDDLYFKVNVKSFYQTNSEQAHELYKITRNYAAIKPEDIVYDLYTGTGTIANFVAKQAKKVVGIEYVPDAVLDANENSKLNKIENTSFFAGDMKKILVESFFEKHGKPDVIITDPPRAGMDEDVVNAILKAEPKTIVYVSCNPATQARDLALLDIKYEVEAIQPVDMFPHTHHVENVVKLILKMSF